MQLYEKIMQGKKTTYREYTPAPINMPEIEHKQIVTLLVSLTISMLMSVEKQLPSHARLPRELKNVQDACVRLAKLNAEPLDEDLVTVGVTAWNAAVYQMQVGLSGGAV